METPHKLVCSRGPAAGRLLHRSRSKCANLCSKCKMHANFTPKSFLSFRLQQRRCSRSWRQNDNVNVTVSRYQHCCGDSLICVRQLHGNYLLSFCSIFLCPKTLTWFSLAWFILTIYIPHNTPPRHVSSIWLGHVTWHKHIFPHSTHHARYSTHRRHTCPVSGWGACPRTRSGRCACRTRRAPAPRRSRAPGPSWGRIRVNTDTFSCYFWSFHPTFWRIHFLLQWNNWQRLLETGRLDSRLRSEIA